MLSWYEDIMKTWEAMNDAVWIDRCPCRLVGMADCAGISRYRCIAGLVVPALAGNRCGSQDCLLFEITGRAGTVIVFDRAVMADALNPAKISFW